MRTETFDIFKMEEGATASPIYVANLIKGKPLQQVTLTHLAGKMWSGPKGSYELDPTNSKGVYKYLRYILVPTVSNSQLTFFEPVKPRWLTVKRYGKLLTIIKQEPGILFLNDGSFIKVEDYNWDPIATIRSPLPNPRSNFDIFTIQKGTHKVKGFIITLQER